MSTPELSRRAYLVVRMMDAGASMHNATEAVASTALAHPEWDMDERHTLAEWWAAERRGEL